MQPSRVAGQKSAPRRSDANDDDWQDKRFKNLHINNGNDSCSTSTKGNQWFSEESELPEVKELKDFEYCWRTKDYNVTGERTGCECNKKECYRGICKCGAGNVRLDKEYRVKNTVRLFHHFYHCNYAECSPKCGCAGRCAMRLRTSKPEFKLIVKPCEVKAKGHGLFTGSKIPRGAFVCELTGTFLSYREWRKTSPSPFVFCFSLKNPWTNSFSDVKQFFTSIDARKIGNESRYINHSCSPNLCLLQSRNHFADHLPTRILFIAKRDILIGEELTFFYGTHWLKYMKDENKSKFACLCQSQYCFLPDSNQEVNATISYTNKQLYPSYESSDDNDDEEET